MKPRAFLLGPIVRGWDDLAFRLNVSTHTVRALHEEIDLRPIRIGRDDTWAGNHLHILVQRIYFGSQNARPSTLAKMFNAISMNPSFSTTDFIKRRGRWVLR